MKKLRFMLVLAFFVSMAVLFALSRWSLGGWLAWAKIGVMAVNSLFSLAVAVIFAATLLRTNGKDLWDTGYFGYMRALWGETWGGYEWPLQISVCRATWLSVITLVPWTIIMAIAGYMLYFFLVGTVTDFEPLFFVRQTGEHTFFDDLGNNIMAIDVLGGMVAFILLYVMVLRESVSIQLKTLPEVSGWTAAIFAAVILIFSIVVVPIKYIGIGTYFLRVGSMLLSIALAAGIIAGVVLLFKKKGSQMAEFLKRETVPGALANARVKAWKEKICPMIIQALPGNKKT